MKNKNILGLDIGTNSVGWAVIDAFESESGELSMVAIRSSGSRVVPMEEGTLGKFDSGVTVSQTHDRTAYRSVRRSYERVRLRRERLLRVLSILKFLPRHFEEQIDRYGHFIDYGEPKLAWCKDAQGRSTFLFKTSFDEMLADFKTHQPALVDGDKKVPYDWTLYYLRKKALTQKIEKEELAWILFNFNQKRGYYQLREEEAEADKKSAKTREYFDSQVVTDIIDTGETYKGLKIYTVVLEDGSKGKVFTKTKPEWVGEKKDIIVTVDIDKNGNDKKDEHGELSCRFKVPTEQEWDEQWSLIKAKTENDLDNSHKTVGEYIYDTLLQQPSQKIRGRLVRTVERKYYRDELLMILEMQRKFHPELCSVELYDACLNELYSQNDAHRSMVAKKDICYLLVNDVLFYQRPLKSKKSLIAGCPYESHEYVDRKTGAVERVPVKCIPKSHPLFQEFRLWQFISNLRIYKKNVVSDEDVTSVFMQTTDDYVALFDRLNDLKEVKQSTLLGCLGIGKSEQGAYRWNYVEDKSYPCNETRVTMLAQLKKAGVEATFLTHDAELALWHILYSIPDKAELRKALLKFAGKYGIEASFADVMQDTPPFKKDYGSYSAKAISRLLPLMRCGKYWKADAIDVATRGRIEKLLSGESDDSIGNRVRDMICKNNMNDVSAFSGLPLWLACYVVYDRHSEAANASRWESPDDIDCYLAEFRQHSLRNPIVEQVVLETLRTVRDIWKQVGHIDEIHVELGRSMKKTSEERAKATKQIQENENTNLRIKLLLSEFAANADWNVEGVKPYSPNQQELLRIFEDTVWACADFKEEDTQAMFDVRSRITASDPKKRPSTSDVKRYRLWLEQRYCSPYTGRIIPLSDLFTSAYEIEHVIPRARYFDDSLGNKVICESEVNQLKGSMLGHEFISRHAGEIVQLHGGGTATIFTVAEYEEFVNKNYAHNHGKLRRLMMDDIPEGFIERQLNDTRYISKLVKSLLSCIVREEGEQEDISKNVIVCTGDITDRLKHDWGINDVWNKIVMPRFERMEKLFASDGVRFTAKNTNGQLIPDMPLEYQRGFNKKRIDHRHHAMDAIVIACATRNIVNYLNNESARKGAKISRYDLRQLLCVPDSKGKYLIKKPWNTFTTDVLHTLQAMVVSFKQRIRVLRRSNNHYWHYENGKKCYVLQDHGNRQTVSEKLHKETYYGEVNLRKIKTVSLNEAVANPSVVVDKELKRQLRQLIASGMDVKKIRKYFEDNRDAWQDVDLKKIPVYYFTGDTDKHFYASRVPLDASFDFKQIDSVTDTGIQKILRRHLEACGGKPEVAFSPAGIEEMNANIASLNDGKPHKPIYKVRKCEQANKFAVGQRGNKNSKYVEAAKGTNLYFAVYETERDGKKKRNFATISLRDVVDRLKRGLNPVPEDANGNRPIFVLSPNDLVYVPTAKELESGIIHEPLNPDRIYKMKSVSGIQCTFIMHRVASVLIDKVEFSRHNKMERSITGEMIKEICVPLKVDRLGNVTLVPL